MTIETKSYLPLADVVAIKIACACGAAYVCPVTGDVDPPSKCRSCGQSFFPAAGTAEYEELTRLVRAVTRLVRLESLPEARWRLRLELRTGE